MAPTWRRPLRLPMILAAALLTAACGRDFEMPLDLPTSGITCLTDSDCTGGLVCQGETSVDPGVCFPANLLAVPNQGDEHALDYRDNLPLLRRWVEEEYGLGPPELIMVNGSHLRADGTIDLGDGVTASWTYQLRVGTSGLYLTVVYWLQAVPGAEEVPVGIVTETGGSPDLTAMSPADIAGYVDPATLIQNLAAGAGCASMSGLPGDTFGLLGVGTISANLRNAQGHTLTADPSTGLGTPVCN